jgi:lon-related putative ATP-dependent protease
MNSIIFYEKRGDIMKYMELKSKEVYKEYSSKNLNFNDTSQLEPFDDIIGQDRAVRAMEFGLTIHTRGYNIYMSGLTGTGKTSYAVSFIKKMAQKASVPDDWCYVYNFEKPNQPMCIHLPAGKGKLFKKDMEEFSKTIQHEIPKAFDGEDYEREKAKIIKGYQEKRNKLLERLSQDAEKQGFKVKTTSAGIYFLPIVDGKTISEQEYGDLEEQVKHEIDERSNNIHMETMDIMRKIKNIENEAQQKVEEWENKVALYAVGVHVNDLLEKYKEYEKVQKYLNKIQEDILENLDQFREDESSDEQPQVVIPWVKMSQDSPMDKYKVNLIVDNSELKGAPIVVDFNPTYYNLVGKFEYENEFGTMTTDYTMIKGGLFHQANGGYLLLQAKDILSNVQSWEVLKRILRTREIQIENMKEQMGLVAVSAIKPEPIPLNIKLILVGSEHVYQMLYDYDEDFRKLFKIKVDFDDEMELNPENVKRLAQFISSFCNREKTAHFHKSAVAKVVEYSTRIVEDQNKLSTRFNEIAEILSESAAWARIEGSKMVKDVHVKKAAQEKIYRSNKYDKKLLEYISEGSIMIATSGEVVGQINGLTILDVGDYAFGKPTRITANTFMGESGIVNIEREIEMSGTSHTKGVLILSGYIGQKFAQEIPLSLVASLCFEQLYSGVDGDSASSAELYAVLSSLSGIPIKQSIAVTGSVNQKGEIQPIGGATAKIEGFFELCKLRGLDGSHGVLIPYQNKKNLVLNEDVVQAVKEGLFHIYLIKTIDEGIEILTGVKAGKKGTNGNYPKGSINYLVYEKLKKYATAVLEFSSGDKPSKGKK